MYYLCYIGDWLVYCVLVWEFDEFYEYVVYDVFCVVCVVDEVVCDVDEYCVM